MIKIILQAGISCFVGTIAFGILFNIKRDKLLYAGFVGAVGGILYKCGIHLGWNEYLSNFIASIGFSICCEILARKLKTPVTTFTVCALIPLVPGGTLYNMMVEVIQGQTMQALSSGVKVVSISITLALGILIVSTFFRIYNAYKTIENNVI